MRSDRRHPQALAWLAVLAVHLLLLWLLLDSSATRAARERPTAPPARIALRLIVARPAALPAPVVGEPPTRARPPTSTRPAAPPNRAGSPRASSGPAAVTVPEREVAARPEPAASAESPAPALLDTEATRRSIRASARDPSLGDQLARARDEPERAGAQARLANGVQAAGKGDCLKGDYAGGGMGLLSVPFLVIAEARGACAK